MSAELQAWALPRLQRLLPIDDESLREIITYTNSLTKEAGADHLKNLLGDSPQALEFISSFNARRPQVSSNRSPSQARPALTADESGVPSPKKRAARRTKPPLHATGPARTPEGYGNVSGGYTKHYDGDDHYSSPRESVSHNEDAPSRTGTADALQVPLRTTRVAPQSSAASRDASPALKSNKLPPSASGSLISDFGFANVRSKQSKKPAHPSHSQPQSGTATPQKGGPTTTTSSVADLTAAIAALELSTNPTLSKERRKCTCNASIHPLFETAPNCLNCGKIICALEGLQPCSFCDAPILSKEQVDSMIKALKEERGIEKMAAHNAGQTHSGRGTPLFGGSTPEALSGDESSSAAARARAHRDKLLAFQRENAQRTRVYDEASDYDMTLTPGATQWMSPVQRAAALKRQQQYIREMEEANRPEWEKKKTVMSMSIRNGKLVRTYERQNVPAAPEKVDNTEENAGVEEDPADQHLSVGGQGAFSNNPLLAGGKLIRPVWKAPEGEEKGKQREPERKSVWRRVQDDSEDNERWILDGGLHGYGAETRLMEDGSQQECG
ncbi:hypothetical protein PV08_01215 [Exophiala spinifera]|uniref:TRIP4/RQT4 C2HC5-type zinc finger domain-containing protein n=1 Tax=Exophiala spinifera TaxID=91928 RepID=A0A0D2CAM9_9EURO|nr:uncharacterized protein PV08_01215 [Exophiala spinifera]KIW20639.1 hypothetical protein PV08_01215 [Exophiala spinifera]